MATLLVGYGRSERRTWPLLHVVAAVLAAAVAPLVSQPVSAAEPAKHFSAFAAGSEKTVDHAVWDRLLKTYVKADASGLNRVDYRGFKTSGQAELKGYIDSLAAVDVASLDRPEQFAFWANLYNAKTIDIVLDHYPVASIKDIRIGGGLAAFFTGGPWKSKVIKVSGKDLSLDDIEHGILRPTFKDPRVHYAVNCASIGCPNLGQQAFSGAGLEAQLDDAARAYINHPRGVRVDGGKVTASSIYKWFRKDFGDSEQGVLQHVLRFAADDLKQKLSGVSSISGYAYDWSLNDIK